MADRKWAYNPSKDTTLVKQISFSRNSIKILEFDKTILEFERKIPQFYRIQMKKVGDYIARTFCENNTRDENSSPKNTGSENNQFSSET